MTRERFKKRLIKIYKHERLYGRGSEYGNSVVASHWREFQENGNDFVSRHESITGKAVYIGNE